MVTIKDIARELNMAVSTVSRALNGSYGVHPKTMERVRQKAREMGYVPDLGARQLVGKRSNLIGIFMPEFDFEATPEFGEIFPSIHKTLKMFGKDVIIFSVPFTAYQPNSLAEWVHMRNLEGCLFMPAFWKEHPLMKDALKLNVPCVNFGDTLGPHCSAINSDDREGGRLAGRLLIRHGHMRIGFIGGPEHLPICKDRYAGFCEVYTEHFGIHEPELVTIGDFSGSSGARSAMELWRRQPGITALFCANDLMAMGAIMELAKTGVRVPEEMSIVGYDGAFFTAYTNPPLTTVRDSHEQIGIRAAEMLMEILYGGTGKRKVIAPVMVERHSVTTLKDK
jgi:LacI family transcriptional regulator